jgi:RNA polymerase sigma-70 factor (ECF subfamily)
MREYKIIEDIEIFKKVKRGDIKSFEFLFDKYYKPLCNFAFLYLKNDEQSEEVVSDVFVNIWIKRNEINIHYSLKAFLYKSTRNAIVSLFRKNKHNYIHDLDEMIKTDSITPETLLLNKEFDDTINELLDELPKISGLVFRMKKIDGLKYREIAKVLNISEKTVENHILAAIKKIRNILEMKPELRNRLKN